VEDVQFDDEPAGARDRNGLVILEHEECLRLLRSRDLGRVAVSVNALPAIFPVNYALSDDAVIIRSSPGTKLDAALDHTVVAFEVDAFEFTDAELAVDHSWSVLVVGTASEVTDPDELERVRALPLKPWTGHVADHFIRIELTQVSGRRIVLR
jgi:nitroimidazol reductase NimA-like FMN-containing flavoprotein (pyridoxamine 5'-phosphate oxidase superfamily)